MPTVGRPTINDSSDLPEYEPVPPRTSADLESQVGMAPADVPSSADAPKADIPGAIDRNSDGKVVISLWICPESSA